MPARAGTMVPHTEASGIWIPAFAGTAPWWAQAFDASFHKSFRRRRDLGDEVAHEPLVGQGRQRHFARGEARRAGIDRRAVEFDHAFLAGVGIDAGEPDRKAGITGGPDPAQAVEHGLSGLERHLVVLPSPGIGAFSAPDFQVCNRSHCAAAGVTTGAGVSAKPPDSSRATWFSRHCDSMPGRSSRWWAPRLSPRASADMVTARATSSMLRRSNQSSRRRSNGLLSPIGGAPRVRALSSIPG